MFRFTAQGTIGRIQALSKGAVRISIAADRIIEGPAKTWTQTEWLGCVSEHAAKPSQCLGPNDARADRQVRRQVHALLISQPFPRWRR